MWTKRPGFLFLLIWILLQVPCTVSSGLRHKTACNHFSLIVDSPCAATEMLLPTMFTLGVSSDVKCHTEIAGTTLRYKGADEIRRCCQQRENDTVTEYCLPAMKNQLRDHYYLDFVNTCTASTRCHLTTPNAWDQRSDNEDYVTFTFDCVHKDTVLHVHHDSTHTGQEVYLYNDQHDGEARASCIAYSHECDSHVIIQLAAARVVSPACQVTFTDGDVSIKKMDCKNPSSSSKCSSTMFESKSNYVNMSIFMTVDPGRQQKEFLWMRAKADTGKNVTVVCGANIPSDISLNCPTSTSTTTTTTTTTPTATVATTTAAAASTTTTTQGATTSFTTTTPPPTTTMATPDSSSTFQKIPETSSASTSQTQQPSETTSAETVASHFDNSHWPPTQPHRFPRPTSLPSGGSSSTLPITLGVSAATLFVGLVLGWTMSRCFYQRRARKNGANIYDTTSTMNEEHTYSTAQPTNTATYANTSYEYYNQ